MANANDTFCRRLQNSIIASNRPIFLSVYRLVPSTVFSSRSGDKQWFDASYRRAYDAKQTAYQPDEELAVQIIGVDLCLIVLRHRGPMVLQESRIMNAPGIL